MLPVESAGKRSPVVNAGNYVTGDVASVETCDASTSAAKHVTIAKCFKVCFPQSQ